MLVRLIYWIDSWPANPEGIPMSVYITFEPAGLSGVVPEGIYLIDAARRMGVSPPTDCQGGGECTGCQVAIALGQSLLSAPTEAEKRMLPDDGLARNQRLACQAMIKNAGELLVRVMPAKESGKTEAAKDLKQTSGELSLERLSTVVQAEALNFLAAYDSVVAKSVSFAEEMMDRLGAKKG